MNKSPISLIAIAGIRSQYIKLAALQSGVAEWNRLHSCQPIRLTSVNSGQHWSGSLSTQYLEEYHVAFDMDFSGRFTSTEPNVVLGEMVTMLSDFLSERSVSADAVTVFGDANTTLAGAVATRRAALPLIHIEAGLRTYRDTPEEVNRVVADHLASLHLASSHIDMANLDREGLGKSSIFTGDIVRDLFMNIDVSSYVDRLHDPFVLATLHRAENTRDPSVIQRVFELLSERGMRCLFLAHPRVLGWALESASPYPNVVVREGCGHVEMARLLSRCLFVITDSGALQREAFYVERRAVVVQDSPFWKSLIDAGVHLRSDTDAASLRAAIDWALRASGDAYPVIEDFGTPPVSQSILTAIVDFVEERRRVGAPFGSSIVPPE